MTVEEILSATRAVRALVKRELTDQEIDHDKRKGRAGVEELLKKARDFRSTLQFETTDEEINEAKRQGRVGNEAAESSCGNPSRGAAIST